MLLSAKFEKKSCFGQTLLREIWRASYEDFKHKDDCLHYAFCFEEGDSRVHCREAYKDAAAVLQHGGDVGAAMKDTLDPAVAELERLEVHGPGTLFSVVARIHKERPRTSFSRKLGLLHHWQKRN